jgi:hypothetical protein
MSGVPEVDPAAPKEPSARPEGGTSLLRTGDEATALRQRLERPARVGRGVMATLGGVILAAGVADWFVTRSPIGLAIAVFGVVLLALGMVQHVLYRRDLAHWPTDVILWDEGIELVLPNGEVRGQVWTDSDIGLQLINRKAHPPADREYLLLWLPDPKIPAVELSAEGFERLTKATSNAGLQISVVRKGHRERGTQMVQIRRSLPPLKETGSKLADIEG